ncbi:electron transport complex subunit RsxC [Paraferrimonas haliotis]|uniref:Ion-translocating oxidoreductase complex subunit C n=1 Tax=Paraferrimonas haliotis TaxID=2013866 RepID=A0AA37TRN2_9GAMM|nr:electron transport complex subunit RsxC [Paraferrimonas haliotis]GLS84428.1 electron transport complex subunit C [Paraferrimonas haliotis]
MMNLLEQIQSDKLWRFHGGIHPPGLKARANQQTIASLPLMQHYQVPITQHVGEAGRIIVKVGDKVLKGQPLTEAHTLQQLPVHAPTSGVISAISEQVAAHPSGLPQTVITVTADGNDQWRPRAARSAYEGVSKEALLKCIQDAGIAGLGGATFPTHRKLANDQLDVVIINGVECEPYISSDDRLMREYASDIFKGIGVIEHLVQPKHIVFAIEDDKPEAAKAIKAAAEQHGFQQASFSLKIVPTKYPSGGEKQLIQLLTGREVDSGTIPAALGIVMQNVGTAYAIKKAVFDDEPMLERVVTVTGNAVAKPSNFWVPIGTVIADLLAHAGYVAQPQLGVILGGPMMGFMLPSINAGVTKACNCLLAADSNEIDTDNSERSCIRCGECAVVCPAKLQPQQLYWHAKAAEHEKSQHYNLFDCIECGCCAFVCPSNIPLVEAYRIEKAAIRTQQLQAEHSQRAKLRFEARVERLEQEKQARANKQKRSAQSRQANMSGEQKDLVAAALARVKAKKAQQAEPQSSGDAKSAAVAKALARAKAKRAAQQFATPEPAKAADETLASKDASQQVTASTTTVDPKKAAIAKAVAKAKAKRAAQQQNGGVSAATKSEPMATPEPAPEPSAAPNAEAGAAPDATNSDPKKAAIARAVAKAKAKREAAAKAQSTKGDSDGV